MNLRRLFCPPVLYAFLMLAGSAGIRPGQAVAQDTASHAEAITDTTTTGEEEYMRTRGIERKPKDGIAPLRKTVNTLLYLPRTLTSALLYSAGYGIELVGNPTVVEKAENILYFHDRVLGWYPQIGFASGASGGIGATVFYRDKPVGGSVSGGYRSSQIWALKTRITSVFTTGNTGWKIDLSIQARNRDDFRFYGFGSDPLTDPRNSFNPNAVEPYGVYVQYLSQVELVTGARPWDDWELFYTVFFRERKVNGPTSGDQTSIDSTFEANTVPGVSESEQIKGEQVYNELAVRFDTRTNPGRISPGVRIEGYAGISVGVGDDDSRFSRGGLDAAFYVPIIKRNRIIMARAIFDIVDNRNEAVPISFTEFPRQRSFRGASTAELLRTDFVSLAPTLEYQWPLTYNLAGHIFVDYLLVEQRASDLTFSNAPYAVGIGIDLQSNQAELARIAVSTGSEGLRIMFTFGLGTQLSNRTRWY